MKIHIRDFGPIHRCDFDLAKDFHLIVGENNVGKSYAITIIYLIIKSALNVDEIIYYLYRDKTLSFYFDNEPSLDPGSIGQGNINRIAADSSKRILNATFVKYLRSSLEGTFETTDILSNQFSGKDLCIELIVDSSTVVLGLVGKQIAVKSYKLNKNIILKGYKKRIGMKETPNEFILGYKEGDDQSKLEALADLVRHNIYSFFLEVIQEVRSIHYLPASRSGLYQALSAFGQIIAELSKSRSFLRNKIELPGISEPLSDYFIKLSNIAVSKKAADNRGLNEIAEKIESDILKGKVNYDPKSKRLAFMPDGTSLKLDLSTTSSMVSELSPIVSYLRYVLPQSPRLRGFMAPREQMKSERAMIIIEEPEAHLHPEIQIKLTDIFVSLIARDVKVVITSHSNYIFNKVNNLILEKRLDINAIEATVFKMTQKGSIGHILAIDDLGIDDDNFIDSAELLYNEKIELIDRMNANV